MSVAVAAGSVELHFEGEPLTERILHHLPGRRWAWLAGWAATPVLFTSVVAPLTTSNHPQPMPSDPVRGVIFAYRLVLSVWAAREFNQRVAAIRANVDRLMSSPTHPDPFKGLTDTALPLATAAAVTAISATAVAYLYEPSAAMASAPFTFSINVAYFTAFWAYVAILRGLHEIGGCTLALDPFPKDPALGLRPVGRLALLLLWVYLAVFLPLLGATTNWVMFSVTFTAFVTGIALFVASLWRIHRQMHAAREEYREWARSLYAQACKPVKGDGGLEALHRQAAALSAAENLERRADRIQRWPFEEGTVIRVVTIVTSVAAMAIARMLLAPLGL